MFFTELYTCKVVLVASGKDDISTIIFTTDTISCNLKLKNLVLICSLLSIYTTTMM